MAKRVLAVSTLAKWTSIDQLGHRTAPGLTACLWRPFHRIPVLSTRISSSKRGLQIGPRRRLRAILGSPTGIYLGRSDTCFRLFGLVLASLQSHQVLLSNVVDPTRKSLARVFLHLDKVRVSRSRHITRTAFAAG